MAINKDQNYKHPSGKIFTVTKVDRDQNAVWITVQHENTVLTYGEKAFKAKFELLKESNETLVDK